MATFWNDEPAQEATQNHLGWGHITQEDIERDGVIGYVALRHCDRFGQLVMVTWLHSGITTGPFVVTDCMAAHDRRTSSKLRVIDVPRDAWFEFARVGVQGGAEVSVWEWHPPQVALQDSRARMCAR